MALSEKLECQRQAKEQDADNVMEREIAILKEAGILLDKVLILLKESPKPNN